MKKHCAIQSRIHSVIINQDKITDQDEINKQIFSFYQSLLLCNVQNQTDKMEVYLEHVPSPALTSEEPLSCEGIIQKNEMFKSLKSMENNKSPGNDELSKEFYECFWDEIKNPFLASIHRAFLNQELSSSQKQTVIKMLEKKTKTKDSSKTGCRYHCLLY